MSRLILRCGKMYDGINDDIIENVDILIESERIAKVGQNLSEESSVTVKDLSDLTVTPGMIDAHVHFNTFEWEKRNHEMLYCSPAWHGMAVLFNAERALRRGFTSIRVCGSHVYDAYSSIDAKKLIGQGYFPGSDLVIAPFYTGAVGGMADASRNVSGNPKLAKSLADSYPGIGEGRDFFISSVREQAKMGGDFIKVMANGGFMSVTGGPEDVQLSDEEYEAIITTAHQIGIPVTAHTYCDDTIRLLVNLGIDGIEHGSLIKPETASLMEEKGTYLVPTMMQYDDIVNMDEESLSKREPKEFRDKLRSYGQRITEGREVIKSSKIKLGYGSDICDQYPCYECGREYKSWLNSGFDPFRALRAATSSNADILGLKEVGRIAPGCRANISAWSRDVLVDPEALMKCDFVMKDGVEYRTEE